MTPSRPRLAATPGQTVGPFFGFALPYPGGELVVPQEHPRSIRLHGTVLDGAGTPVPDALLEIWQAGANGQPSREPGSLRRDGYTFTGWGRCPTDNVGHYSFTTLEPGGGGAGSGQRGFIAMTVFARGLNTRLFTRVYLPVPDPIGHDAAVLDPFLASLPADRRRTLIAVRDDDGSLRFDLRLQGPDETVFLSFGD